MELFAINRFDIEPKTASDPNGILNNLKRKIEKRKKDHKQKEQQESVKENHAVLNTEEEKEEPKIKKKKVKQKKSKENVVGATGGKQIKITKKDETKNDNTAVDYQILDGGVDAESKKMTTQNLSTALSPWMAYPTFISNDIAASDKKKVANLKHLESHILETLKEMKIKYLFPVQATVIPWILEQHAKPIPFRPRDICVSAPTGSGKTFAFVIPIVQLLAKRVQRKIRALIVLPVAELATQIYGVFKKFCEKTDLTVCLLSKQCAFRLEQEKLVESYKGQYYSKVDIVVTTPGRLIDHLHATNGFCLKSLKFLVVDEADRILDAVFQNWLYHFDTHVRDTSDQLLSGRMAPLCFNELRQNTQPHKLLYSATLSQDPEKLQKLRLFHPKLFTSVVDSSEDISSGAKIIEFPSEDGPRGTETRKETKTTNDEYVVGTYITPVGLKEKYCLTESRLKPLTLYALITENNWKKFLCFTNSADTSQRLAFVLSSMFKNQHFIIENLSALLNATQRANVLNQFTRGNINGLICSDALARGIDVSNVDIVISYDIPRHITTYIHRIGRTARAGQPGTAITLLTQKELNIFNRLLAVAGKVVNEEIHTSTTTEEQNARIYSEALNQLNLKLEFDKRLKQNSKARVKELSTIHKKQNETMTVMEKLQADTIKKTQEKAIQKDFLNSRKNLHKKIQKRSKAEKK